jgi:hypothetical protein
MLPPHAFTPDPDTSTEPVTPSKVGRRSASRLRLAIPVRMVSTLATQNCILLDLSRTGARIGLPEPLAPGACLYLTVGHLELFGEVVRRDPGAGGGINGLHFDEPLRDAEVLAVRRHAETFEQRERDTLRDQVRRWVSGENRI